MRPNAPLLALSALSLLALACAPAGGEPTAAPAPAQQTAQQPAQQPAAEAPRATESRLIERSAERWRLSCAKEWIDVYEFISPAARKQMSIYSFLEGKDNHTFESPSTPHLVAVDGKKAYVEVSVTWTPQHPMLTQVELEPGQTLTERFELIETWEWVKDDWYMEWPPERPSEFFEAHPDLLKKKNATAQAEGAASPGESKAKDEAAPR